MTNHQIYTVSLSQLGLELSTASTQDYEERAPYLLAAFCSMSKTLDRNIRRLEGLENQGKIYPVYEALSAEFPLCDLLVSPASTYLAAMLVIDEDPELSDSLYDKYCDDISTLGMKYDLPPSLIEDPAKCEGIIDRYNFS